MFHRCTHPSCTLCHRSVDPNHRQSSSSRQRHRKPLSCNCPAFEVCHSQASPAPCTKVRTCCSRNCASCTRLRQCPCNAQPRYIRHIGHCHRKLRAGQRHTKYQPQRQDSTELPPCKRSAYTNSCHPEHRHYRRLPCPRHSRKSGACNHPRFDSRQAWGARRAARTCRPQRLHYMNPRCTDSYRRRVRSGHNVRYKLPSYNCPARRRQHTSCRRSAAYERDFHCRNRRSCTARRRHRYRRRHWLERALQPRNRHACNPPQSALCPMGRPPHSIANKFHPRGTRRRCTGSCHRNSNR